MAQTAWMHHNFSVFVQDFSEVGIVDVDCEMAWPMQDLKFEWLNLAADVQWLVFWTHIDVPDNFYF